MANIHVSFRTPEELVEKVDGDASRLRRSRGSILTEIIEKYYENGHVQQQPETTKKKKAGAR
jgi:predicted DNA-binding protein